MGGSKRVVVELGGLNGESPGGGARSVSPFFFSSQSNLEALNTSPSTEKIVVLEKKLKGTRKGLLRGFC